MAWSVTTAGERIFQHGIVQINYEKSGHYYMSDIYKSGLSVVAFQK